MSKRFKFLYILFAVLTVLSCTAVQPAFAEETTQTSIEYIFTGENKDDPGFAEGTLVINKGNDCLDGNYFCLFFGDGNGILENYKQITSVKICSGTTTVCLPRKMLIPEGATRVLLFETDSASSEGSSILNFIAYADIPESKRYVEGTQTLRFASLSDLHLNYDWASEKWYRALCYFEEIGIDLIAISGDYTNDGSKAQFDLFRQQITDSGYTGKIWGCIGNHDTGDKRNYKKYFKDYGTNDTDLYFYQIADNGDVFIFLAQDKLPEISLSNTKDCFSDEQLDWLEGLLQQYSNTGVNIFIYEHANFFNWGAGDFIPGIYVQPLNIGEEFPNNTRLMAILYEYKEVIEISGHTHVAFDQYRNFDDNNGTSARTVHNSSVSQIRVINNKKDGLIYNTNEVDSEGYIVTVYEDSIVFRGMDLAIHKYIPAACFMLESISESHDIPDNIESIAVNTDKTLQYLVVGTAYNDIRLTLTVTLTDGTSYDINSGYNALCLNEDGVLTSGQGFVTSDADAVIVFYGAHSTVFYPLVVEDYPLAELKGSGTKDDPYLIETAYDFYCFTRATSTSVPGTGDFLSLIAGKSYFRQTADIDMATLDSKYVYEGNPASKYVNYCFEGVYDGGGHKLAIDISCTNRNVSVFPYVSGLIVNLDVSGSIKLSSGYSQIQPIAGVTKDGAIVNCLFDFSFENGTPSALSPDFKGNIYNCYISSENDGITLSSAKSGMRPNDSDRVFTGFEAEGYTLLSKDSAIKELMTFDEEKVDAVLSRFGYETNGLVMFKKGSEINYLLFIGIAIGMFIAVSVVFIAVKKKNSVKMN